MMMKKNRMKKKIKKETSLNLLKNKQSRKNPRRMIKKMTIMRMKTKLIMIPVSKIKSKKIAIYGAKNNTKVTRICWKIANKITVDSAVMINSLNLWRRRKRSANKSVMNRNKLIQVDSAVLKLLTPKEVLLTIAP